MRVISQSGVPNMVPRQQRKRTSAPSYAFVSSRASVAHGLASAFSSVSARTPDSSVHAHPSGTTCAYARTSCEQPPFTQLAPRRRQSTPQRRAPAPPNLAASRRISPHLGSFRLRRGHRVEELRQLHRNLSVEADAQGTAAAVRHAHAPVHGCWCEATLPAPLGGRSPRPRTWRRRARTALRARRPKGQLTVYLPTHTRWWCRGGGSPSRLHV